MVSTKPANRGWPDPTAAIRAEALARGFSAVGIVRPPADAFSGRLDAFLDQGRHGDMTWMADRRERRADPRVLWPAVRTIVAVALDYGPAADPLASLARPERGTISTYAQGEDYHDVMKKRLKALGRWIADTFAADVKVFVDTAPVMEKPLAAAAGLGWQGKHTNLVSRRHGSWLFLGEIFTTLDLAADTPEPDRCGSCRACLDVCPTLAFPAPYQLDARRCISYLTIEHKGHIATEFRRAIGNRIYGCDDCLAVCPWNKFARASAEIAFQPRLELTAPLLRDLAALDDATFRSVFARSSIKRLGRDRFLRNVLIAIGNSGDLTLAAAAEGRLGDGSPLVRAMAVWALAQLLSAAAFAGRRARHAGAEADAAVLAEWGAA
ncbi:MAG: tRNA epoxyqueuosine(34) reductase QueG [Alphaproteobacteria bacterium]|nr:tRNA epoxyqueuosine(34) reductase QueG [Alphaproteobacteria bacterium]